MFPKQAPTSSNATRSIHDLAEVLIRFLPQKQIRYSPPKSGLCSLESTASGTHGRVKSCGNRQKRREFPAQPSFVQPMSSLPPQTKPLYTKGRTTTSSRFAHTKSSGLP